MGTVKKKVRVRTKSGKTYMRSMNVRSDAAQGVRVRLQKTQNGYNTSNRATKVGAILGGVAGAAGGAMIGAVFGGAMALSHNGRQRVLIPEQRSEVWRGFDASVVDNPRHNPRPATTFRGFTPAPHTMTGSHVSYARAAHRGAAVFGTVGGAFGAIAGAAAGNLAGRALARRRSKR